MDRKRTVAAAGGLSLALIATSATFAFANGIFGTRPVDRVGTYPAMMARLVPETTPVSTATTAAGAPPPKGTDQAPAASAHDARVGDFEPSTVATTTPASMPSPAPTAIAPAPEVTPTPTTDEPSDEPADTPTTATPTTVTPTTVAHSGPSAVTGGHEPDDASDDSSEAASDD